MTETAEGRTECGRRHTSRNDRTARVERFGCASEVLFTKTAAQYDSGVYVIYFSCYPIYHFIVTSGWIRIIVVRKDAFRVQSSFISARRCERHNIRMNARR